MREALRSLTSVAAGHGLPPTGTTSTGSRRSSSIWNGRSTPGRGGATSWPVPSFASPTVGCPRRGHRAARRSRGDIRTVEASGPGCQGQAGHPRGNGRGRTQGGPGRARAAPGRGPHEEAGATRPRGVTALPGPAHRRPHRHRRAGRAGPHRGRRTSRTRPTYVSWPWPATASWRRRRWGAMARSTV